MLYLLDKTTKRKGTVIAQNNQENVLGALTRFGWLTARQLSHYCWPDATGPRMAQSTIAQLLKLQHVQSYEAQATDGKLTPVYALTPKGVARVHSVFGVKTAGIKDVARRANVAFGHRHLANDVCIWWEHQTQNNKAKGYATEHEIQTKGIKMARSQLQMFSDKGKIADGLLYQYAKQDPMLNPHIDEFWASWLEVEWAHKNKDKQAHMAREIAEILTAEHPQIKQTDNDGINAKYRLKTVVVACPTAAHVHRLKQFIDQVFVPGHHFDAHKVRENLLIWRPENGGYIQSYWERV